MSDTKPTGPATPLEQQPREGGLPLVVVKRPQLPARRQLLGPALQRAKFVPLIMALVAFGGIVGMYFQPPGLKFIFRTFGLTPGGGTSTPIAVPAPSNAPASEAAPQRRVVVGLGKLVPQGDVITVAPPFGAGDSRVAELKVGEGERVKRGDVIARMDNEGQLKAALAAASATVAAREAAYEQTLANVRASRDEARATLERTLSAARNAEREMQRIEQLFKKGISTEAAFEQKRTARDETAREVEKARATLSRWESVDPEQQPDAIVARRNIETARAELTRAERDLDKAYVTAPLDGTVLTVHTRTGEKPGAQGLMTIGDIDRMTVEVEVYQTQIGAVAVGDAVTVTADALARALSGTVTRIGLEVGRQVLLDTSPAASTDARVVKVHVALEPESSKLAQRFTNLQVTARIAVGPRP